MSELPVPPPREPAERKTVSVDSDDVRSPIALIMVMRHARSQPSFVADNAVARHEGLQDRKPDGSPDPEGATETVRDIGRTLAEVLNELAAAGETYDRLVIVRERPTGASAQTAAVLGAAYDEARQLLGRAPKRADIVDLDASVVSPYADPKSISDAMAAELGALLKLADNDDEQVAVLVVGHEPRMSWLVEQILDAGSSRLAQRRRRALIPGLMRTELLACARRSHGRFDAVWALSPSDPASEEAVRAKVRSKMETAKVFAGLLTAFTGFVVSEVSKLRGLGLNMGTLGLGFLGAAIALYLVTMFWYDRLLMPTRFWAPTVPRQRRTTQPHRRRRPERHLLQRPPSSSTWVLYQNMQLVWLRCFVPATWAATSGTTLYVVGVLRDASDGARFPFMLIGFAAIGVAVAALARLGQPRLGISD
jgi:hypothetical protein